MEDCALDSARELTTEDPAAIIAALARQADAAGNARAARILSSTAQLLAAAMRPDQARP